jgi:hypothetical protein
VRIDANLLVYVWALGCFQCSHYYIHATASLGSGASPPRYSHSPATPRSVRSWCADDDDNLSDAGTVTTSGTATLNNNTDSVRSPTQIPSYQSPSSSASRRPRTSIGSATSSASTAADKKPSALQSALQATKQLGAGRGRGVGLAARLAKRYTST